jgi:MFS family permease
MQESTPISTQGNQGRWLLFGIIAAVYFLVYFHRVSTSVVATHLIADLHTDAAFLGLISSMYFYLYAVEQPFVGYLADRLGPGTVVGCWSVVAAIGCFIFGLATTVGVAAIGRGFIGFGVGGVYVPAMKLFSQRFHRKQFATAVGLLMATGNLGAIVATAPLAWSATTWGWRRTFFLIGGITILLAVCALLISRITGDRQPQARADGDAEPAVRHLLHSILLSLRFWVFAATFLGVYGTFITFQGLWAAPYLIALLDIDPVAAGELTMAMPVGFMIGAPLCGWLGDRIGARKEKLFIGLLSAITLCWAFLLRNAVSNPATIIILFGIMGAVSGGFFATLWSLMREGTPTSLMGLTAGLLNPAPFAGVAIYQILTGWMVNRYPQMEGGYPVAAFRGAFGISLITCLAGLALCILFRRQLGKKKESG